LRIAFRDNPVRRSISLIGMLSGTSIVRLTYVPLSEFRLRWLWAKGWKAATAWPAFDFQPNRIANPGLDDAYESCIEARSFRQRNRRYAVRDEILELGQVSTMEANPAEDPPVATQGSPKQARGTAALAIRAARYLDRTAVITLLTDKLCTLQGIPIGPALVRQQRLDRLRIDREIALDDGMTCHGCLMARDRR
jgi:hypothetical protein